MPSAEFKDFVATLRAAPQLKDPTIEAVRENWDRVTARFQPAPDVCFTPVLAGGVPAEWAEAPGIDRDRIVLFFHGGGYNIGSVATYRGFAARLSRATGARVLSLEYRLAPEHPFPAAVDDTLAAYAWLIAAEASPERVAIIGDSAGGGLTFATAVRARDAGLAGPAALVAISPSTDLAKTGVSIHERAHLDPLITLASTTAHAERYLGAQGDPTHPLASPLYADLHGLPPTLVMVGTAEMLFDDSSRIAAKAAAAGVEIELDVWEDMIHIWPFFADILPEGAAAIDKIGRFVRARIP